MLQLGDVLVREDEVVSVAWRSDRLRLVLRWELEEVPVLLDLAEQVNLTWHGEDDPDAGLPVKILGWSWSGEKLSLALRSRA